MIAAIEKQLSKLGIDKKVITKEEM